MHAKLLDEMVRKLRHKFASLEEQLANLPKQLTLQEKSYVRKRLDKNAYYKKLKRQQLETIEQQFYDTFTVHNPLSSKDKVVANRKQRELHRTIIYQKIPKSRLFNLLKNYIIPCDNLSAFEIRVLTDPLLITCIDRRLRRYVKVRATELGGNLFRYYLMKENWKHESVNHLVWKFELKHRFNFRIEQLDYSRRFRIDCVRHHNNRWVYVEIVCTRQSADKNFQRKIRELERGLKGRDVLILLAPTRLHKYLLSLASENVLLVDSKNVLAVLKRLFAHK
jgi:hypothetical protein